MEDESRTDSTGQLVGVTDFSTYSRLLDRGIFVPRTAVSMGLQMIAGISREEASRSRVRVLCDTFGADDTLQTLKGAAERADLGFRIPQVEDELCVILPDSRREVHELFCSYTRVLVIGSDGLVAHVAPAGERAVTETVRRREETLV